jgi:hypothetical protein
MADALEAVGQNNVEEKTADELGGLQCHERIARSVPVFLPGEHHALVCDFIATCLARMYSKPRAHSPRAPLPPPWAGGTSCWHSTKLSDSQTLL